MSLKNPKRFYRDEDGHTYEMIGTDWVGYPTMLDGSIQEDAMTYVEDMEFESEIKKSQLIDFLNNCKKDNNA